jgi:catechol 2,3-dioxygenase-like lactoylglutathione lyase family enzyme
MRAPRLRLDHVALPVSDVAASYRFYREVLQLPLVQTAKGDDWGGRAWLMMTFAAGDGRQLVLCALAGAAPPTLTDAGLPRDVRHYGFSVASSEERQAWKERLEDCQVRCWEEDHGTQQSLYFSDPDGTILEITTPSSEDAATADPDAVALVESWVAAR